MFIVGAGALGCASADMLVRAGVQRVTIVDRDYVEWSNLQRQSLYTEADVEQHVPKAIAAQRRLTELNRDCTVVGIVQDVYAQTILPLLRGHDIIIDATDNFETSLLLNDAAMKENVPYIFGACVGSYGLALPIVPNETPCLHCLLQHVPFDTRTCDTVGVISPIVHITASLQVTLFFKWLAGNALPIIQSIDVWRGENASIHVEKLKNVHCPSCSDARTYPFLQTSHETKAYVLCGRNAVQVRPADAKIYALQQLATTLTPYVTKLTVNPYLLSCTFDDKRIVFFADGRAIIHGVSETDTARRTYDRFVQLANAKHLL